MKGSDGAHLSPVPFSPCEDTTLSFSAHEKFDLFAVHSPRFPTIGKAVTIFEINAMFV